MVIDIDQYPAQPKHNFEDFFKNYEDSPNHFKYREEIQNAALRKKYFIFVLFEDILSYDPPLAELLREAPEETLREGVEAFKDLLKFYSGGIIDESVDYFVRIKTENNSNEVTLRKLRAEHIDKLVYIYGILIRASQIIPQITVAYFECPICQQVTKVDQVETSLIIPKQCSNCKNKSGFMVTSKDSKFIDWQSIRIQELPEEMQPGRVPYSLKGILTHDLVDKVRPGDRVKITGIFKTYVNENSRGKKSTLFTPYLKVLSVEGKNAEDDQLNISPDDEKEFKRLAAKPNIQELIAKSVAPSILGLDHLKMAAALSLFGGVRKELKDGSAHRGDIHVLFIGDPGTGKSQILKMCTQISPQAIYVSGKGSSAAGLTAAVVRENDASGLSLEAGALVLADGGNAIIDEFDKMDNRDRVAIHEAMEQQSYHPSTEILTTFGNKIRIGEYVDNLMELHKKQIIPGIDCEILLYSDLTLFSTNFQNIYPTKIDRVSRHRSPEIFYKFIFSNDHSIMVTPEHPFFIYSEKKIITIPAEACKVGMRVPASNDVPRFVHETKIDMITHTILEIQKIPNKGKYYTPWVYDITVEPNHTFISHGLILHNTVSVAKAGIIATLRARTSIIAAANPKMGRYSEYKTPTENINLSPAILSRFDLIFVVKDEPNESFDQEMADFILDLNTQDNQIGASTNKEPLIPSEVLQKYIKYARNKVFPKLTPDARKVIRDFYVELRKVNRNDENAAIAVVARSLEGFIRIAEAYAKMALRNYVTKDDAEKALELAKRSLKDTSLDPITGKFDADRVLTGITTAQARIAGFLDALKHKIDANGGKPIDEEEFITDLEFKKDIERSKIEKLLEKLVQEGTIYRPNPGMLEFSPDTEEEKKMKSSFRKPNYR